MRLAVIVLFLAFLSFESWAATPKSKTFTAQDYSTNCGQGKYGIKCNNFEAIDLKYSIPTKREDGSDLSREEISHFVVQFEKDGGITIQFSVPKTNNFQLPRMPSGSYVFRIATVDTSGQQGAFSQDYPVTF